MFNPLSLASSVFGGIWGYVAAAVVAGALAASGTYYVVHNADVVKLQKVELADSQQKAADISASLTQLQGFITNMHAADAGYNDELAHIDAEFSTLKKGLANALRTPLPLDCKPTADRVRVLHDALSAVNARRAVP